MNQNYRPEIDGLRALAVLSVVFYHIKLEIFDKIIFKNGFLGVDIFFVISGFLITRILILSIINKDKYIILNFYIKRIKRILPVLLFIIFIFTPLGWLYLTPSFYVDFSKSLISAIAFVSNFYFLFSAQIYGAVGSEYLPFLHTWSLAVEEQFYLLYPIFLILTFTYFKKYFLSILIIFLILSLGLAEFLASNYPAHNFFLLPSRLWQILLGAIIAVYMVSHDHKTIDNNYGNFIVFLSMTFMVFPILFFPSTVINIGKIHPSISFLSILPSLGAALFILFSNNKLFFTKFLSSKIMVFFGLISYSLYLWHYPILAFNKIVNFYDDTLLSNKIIFFISIVLLSYVSYRLIETPFRKKFTNKITISFISLLILIIFFISILVIKNNGYENRYKDFRINLPGFEIDNRKLQKIRNLKLETLIKDQNISKIKKNVLIIGDSHAHDFYISFSLNKGLFPNHNFIFEDLHIFEEKLDLNENYLNEYDTIIIANRWHELSLDYIDKRFDQIDNLKNKNLNIVVASSKTEFFANELFTIIDYKIKKTNFKNKINSFKNNYFLQRTITSKSPINIYLKKKLKLIILIF